MDDFEGDKICLEAIEKYKFDSLLNDGDDNLLHNIQTQSLSSSLSVYSEFATDLLNDGIDYIFENIQIPSFSDETVTLHRDENIHGWDNIVLHRINEVRANKIIAGALEDMFFSFENLPAYMVNLFVHNNIANYSYAMRNKICFWGNGSPIDTEIRRFLMTVQ